MDVPDKIFLHPDIGDKEFIRPWLKRAFNKDSVAYICKNTLLTWAVEQKNNSNLVSENDIWDEVIKKIESL